MGYAQAIVGEISARDAARGQPAPPARARAADARAARLVQPAAAQHAVPGAGPDRLHRDDHRRRLHRAVGRAREGARHDGAGPHGADRARCRSSSARRCRTLAIVVRLGAADRAHGAHGAVRPADARLLAAAAARSICCSWSARWAWACSSRRRRHQQVAFQVALLSSFLPTLHAVGLHLSDREHADGRPGRSPTSCRRATSSSRCAASC